MVEFLGDVNDGREVVIGGAETGAGGISIEQDFSPKDAIEFSAAIAAKSGGLGIVLSFNNEEGLNSCSSKSDSLSLKRSPEEAERVGEEEDEDVEEALDCELESF